MDIVSLEKGVVRQQAEKIGKTEGGRSLNLEQRDKAEKFLANPIYGAAVAVLTRAEGIEKVGLYGGFGLIVGTDRIETDSLRQYYDGPFDEKKCADADLMAKGLVSAGVEKIADLLRDRYRREGLNVAVEINKDDRYPRIVVRDEGREILSVSDLGASVGFVREVFDAIGKEIPVGSDWEIWTRSQKILAMKTVIFGKRDNLDEAGIMGKEGVGTGLDLNPEALANTEICVALDQAGRNDLKREVIREIGGWAGRVLLLSVTGRGFMSLAEGDKRIDAEMKYLSSCGSEELKGARRVLGERLARALQIDSIYAVKKIGTMGIMRLYSKSLGKRLEKAVETGWQDVRASLINKLGDRDGFSGMSEFVVWAGKMLWMNDEEFASVSSEMARSWDNSVKNLEGWARREAFDTVLDSTKLVEDWSKMKAND